MVGILDSLMGQLGGSPLKNLSQQIGADEKTTQGAIGAALPLLLGALARNAQDGKGASALSGALERDHDGGILDNLGGFFGGGDTSPGQGILKHVLGGKQPAVETGVAHASGLDTDSAGKLLAMLAPMVMGALGKAKRESGLDAGALAGMLSNERQAIERRAPQQMGMLGKLLDADGDGDVDLGDGIKALGKLFGR